MRIHEGMRSGARSGRGLGAALLLAAAGCASAGGRGAPAFPVEEASIAGIHQAMLAGRLSARELVQRSLERIEAYDKRGPYLNAIVTTHPRALEVADSLDAVLARTGRLGGPLHGIPFIVKDNYDTRDLPTTAGSLSLANSIPPDDAYQVRKIREAGGIVLAKSNLAEFAFTPYETVGSRLPGYTRNPYDPTRVTAGSSGGTAAAVAASFGTVGLGTDTGNSIRGPAAHQALVGIRSTMGLTSRDGIVPLFLGRDVGGPMTRSVADAVAVLDVIAGPDPADTVTLASRGRMPEGGYSAFLRADGMRGKRIGVVRQLSNSPTTDPEVVQRFEEALEALRRGGASVVDVRIPELDDPGSARGCASFRADLNAYLASLGPDAPVKNLDEVIASGKYHPTVAARLRSLNEITDAPESSAACAEGRAYGEKLRASVRRVMADQSLDALAYPTWSNPPRLIGDLNTPHGDNSQQLAPPTGFPAISVPMGYVRGNLPVGLQILGDAWSEPTLIEIAYSYEQATRHRRPPGTTPPLR